MGCTRALARLNRGILEAYSRRTTETLRRVLPLRLALPHLEAVLATNVAKEVEKDRLVIRCAADALAAGAAPSREALDRLLEETKAIDTKFISGVGVLPVEIVIRYEDIAPVRMRRIASLVDAAYKILAACRSSVRLRAALRSSFARSELERFVLEDLRLYAREVLVLSRSLRLPRLLAPVREMLAQRLVDAMEEAAMRLAQDAARAVYRPERVPRAES